MTTSRKLLCLASLAAAGLVSLACSFWGLFAFAWGGTDVIKSPSMVICFLPYLLALPLFVLAAALRKRATIILWILVPVPAVCAILGSIHDIYSPPGAFARLLLYPVVFALPLLFLTALTQFATRFYTHTHDPRWVRWKETSNEPAA